MNEKSNKTAVDWLKKELEGYGDTQYCELTWNELDELCEHAKEMEREQMATNCNQLYKPTMIFGEHKIQMLEIDDEEIKEVAIENN